MPGFMGNGQATLLRENKQAWMFQVETNVAGRPSVAFQLERLNRTAYPWGVSFQLYFTDSTGLTPSSPGVFEVDIQTSDIDQDAQYCTINAISGLTSLNSSFAGRLELPNFYAKYVRAVVKTLTNAVYTSLLVTR